MSENKVVSYQCPSCGHPVPVGSPMCPGCHRIFKQEDIGKYSAKIEEIRSKAQTAENNRKDTKRARRGAVIAVIVLAALLIGAKLFIQNRIDAADTEMQRIYQQVQTAILAGDYDLALLNAQNMRPDGGLSKNLTEKWDQIREDTIQLIEEKKKSQ